MTTNSALNFIVRESHITEKPQSYYRDNSDSLRCAKLLEDMNRPEKTPRFLLLDDDPILCRIMARAAETLGIELTYLASLNDLSKLTSKTYDVALIDYDLGFLNGYEVAHYLEEKVHDLPVILISHLNNLTTNRWPVSIREFIHKKLGPFAMLDAALEAYEINMFHKSRSRTRGRKRRSAVIYGRYRPSQA